MVIKSSNFVGKVKPSEIIDSFTKNRTQNVKKNNEILFNKANESLEYRVGIHLQFLILSQTTNFRCFQSEIVCRPQFKIDENGRIFSKSVENTVGKGDVACFELFLFFPQYFLKTCTRDR